MGGGNYTNQEYVDTLTRVVEDLVEKSKRSNWKTKHTDDIHILFDLIDMMRYSCDSEWDE